MHENTRIETNSPHTVQGKPLEEVLIRKRDKNGAKKMRLCDNWQR